MAIKIIEYSVSVAGITPATEQFGGTQGDHRVTAIKFLLTDELYSVATAAANDGKLMYRFDVYDGEGGIWSSAPAEVVNNSVMLELEERHTRFGGKITVYLVITVLSEDNQTEMELYSFPMMLRLKNRPDGIHASNDNHESLTTLFEIAKDKSDEVLKAAQSAENANLAVHQLAADVEQKLRNGEYDGADGVSVTHTFDGTVLTVTSASGTTSVDLKGDTGNSGVYVGSGDMPENCNVQIDVEGDTIDMDSIATKQYVENEIESLKGEIDLSNYPTNDELSAQFDSINTTLEEIGVDYIVKRGTVGIWNYEKWASGKAVCWGNILATYKDENNLTATINLPFEMKGEIYAQVTKISGMAAFNTLYATTCYEATSAQIIVAANNSGSAFGENDNIALSVHIMGSWKE